MSTTTRVWFRGAMVSAAMAATLSSCASEDVETATETGDIIGGVALSTARYNAIGTVAIDDNLQCAGTLITPTMVLTSRLCAWGFWDMSRITFLIGPDASAPIRTVPVRGWVEAEIVSGVFGNGPGLAVLHLADPVTDVTPIPFREITEADVGREFLNVGFGLRDATGAWGTRRAGTLTLRALGGSLYETVYGSFEAFVAAAARGLYLDIDVNDPSDIAFLEEEYARQLFPGFEAWFGGGSDAQPCWGDGGGPIIGRENGQTYVYGVASWMFTIEGNPLCELVGGAFSTISAQSRVLLDYEIACPLIPEQGTCEDVTTTLRCATKAEGGFRELRTDCSELGLMCGFTDDTGELGCVEGSFCSHDVCTEGPNLPQDCGVCENLVCGIDPFCCRDWWDASCVAQAQTLCDRTCPVE